MVEDGSVKVGSLGQNRVSANTIEYTKSRLSESGQRAADSERNTAAKESTRAAGESQSRR